MTPGNSLYFPAVDFLRTKVGKIGVKDGYSRLPVVIDCRHILGADFTAAKVLIYFYQIIFSRYVTTYVRISIAQFRVI